MPRYEAVLKPFILFTALADGFFTSLTIPMMKNTTISTKNTKHTIADDVSTPRQHYQYIIILIIDVKYDHYYNLNIYGWKGAQINT